jgi:hypothetical protein
MNTSCNKKNTTAPTFSGITSRDTQAQPMGVADNNDWRLDNIWQTIESDLFPNLNSSTTLCTSSSLFNNVAAYPNPVNDIGSFSIKAPTTAKLSFRVVDQSFSVLLSRDNLSPNNNGYFDLSFSFNQLGIQNQMVRMYYFIEDSNQNCVFRGHGDILVR